MVERIESNFSQEAFFEDRLEGIHTAFQSALISPQKLSRALGELFSIRDLTQRIDLKERAVSLIGQCQSAWIDRKVEALTDRALFASDMLSELQGDIDQLENDFALSEENRRMLLVAKRIGSQVFKPTLLDFDDRDQIAELLYECVMAIEDGRVGEARLILAQMPENVKNALAEWGDLTVYEWAVENRTVVQAIFGFLTGQSKEVANGSHGIEGACE